MKGNTMTPGNKEMTYAAKLAQIALCYLQDHYEKRTRLPKEDLLPFTCAYPKRNKKMKRTMGADA